MARLVTLDVTNTCIRVVKSVGYHYVSYLTHSESCLSVCKLQTNGFHKMEPFAQARVAKEFGMILEVPRVDAAFKYVRSTPQ